MMDKSGPRCSLNHLVQIGALTTLANDCNAKGGKVDLSSSLKREMRRRRIDFCHLTSANASAYLIDHWNIASAVSYCIKPLDMLLNPLLEKTGIATADSTLNVLRIWK